MKGLCRLPLKLHEKVRPGVPVALNRVETLRRLGWGQDPLTPPPWPVRGAEIDHPVLAQALGDVLVGTWTVGPRTIAYLRTTIQLIEPRLVLEFGSGVSTLCIAQFLADQAAANGGTPGRVISIEQSAEEAHRTEQLLRRHNLESHVHLIVAPLRMREIEGRYVSAYTFSDQVVEEHTGTHMVDLVVVDGPAAESGARYGTIPLIRRFVRPGATFLLDDALRDGEISVASGWTGLEYISVEGIVPVEHGLLRGTFLGSE